MRQGTWPGGIREDDRLQVNRAVVLTPENRMGKNGLVFLFNSFDMGTNMKGPGLSHLRLLPFSLNFIAICYICLFNYTLKAWLVLELVYIDSWRKTQWLLCIRIYVSAVRNTCWWNGWSDHSGDRRVKVGQNVMWCKWLYPCFVLTIVPLKG